MNTHEIETVSDNIREFLIDSNSKTGGHIGANLGISSMGFRKLGFKNKIYAYEPNYFLYIKLL